MDFNEIEELTTDDIENLYDFYNTSNDNIASCYCTKYNPSGRSIDIFFGTAGGESRHTTDTFFTAFHFGTCASKINGFYLEEAGVNNTNDFGLAEWLTAQKRNPSWICTCGSYFDGGVDVIKCTATRAGTTSALWGSGPNGTTGWHLCSQGVAHNGTWIVHDSFWSYEGGWSKSVTCIFSKENGVRCGSHFNSAFSSAFAGDTNIIYSKGVSFYFSKCWSTSERTFLWTNYAHR